jgi:2-oxoglutarate dehydrogenase complex dehydrogenase (E1) component-like enzyme
VAIIRVEQLYPFPHKAFATELKKYPNATDIVWCQDEPQNQGAWFFVQHYIHENMLEGQKLGYSGRPHRPRGGGLFAPAPGAAEGAAGPGRSASSRASS